MSIHRFVNEHSLQFHFQEPQTESNLNVYQQVDKLLHIHIPFTSVGTRNSRASLENSLAVSYKIENTLTGFSNAISTYVCKKN